MEKNFRGTFNRSFLNSSFIWHEMRYKKLSFEQPVTKILDLTEQQGVTPYTQLLHMLCVQIPNKEEKLIVQ